MKIAHKKTRKGRRRVARTDRTTQETERHTRAQGAKIHKKELPAVSARYPYKHQMKGEVRANGKHKRHKEIPKEAEDILTYTYKIHGTG